MTRTCYFIGTEFLYYPMQRKLVYKNDNKEVELDYLLARVLHLLLERSGEIIPKETFIKNIWQDYPGSDNSLHNSISRLRNIFSNKEIIKTHPKLGYSFQTSVTYDRSKKNHSIKPIYFIIVLLSFTFIIDENTSLQPYNVSKTSEIIGHNDHYIADENIDCVELTENEKTIIKTIKSNPAFLETELDKYRTRVENIKDSLNQ
jgi:DNA-binding winged helix-turn-helix (wHTH) protein